MFKTKANDFIPQESLITFKDIEKECREKGREVSVRTLRFYIGEGLLPKPMYIKKTAYYDRNFILDELEAIYVLRTLFGKGIEDIAKLAKNAFGSLRDIVSSLHDILDRGEFKKFSKHKNRPLGFRYVNSKLMQFLAKRYFEEINKGWWPDKMKDDKFVDAVLMECQKKEI